MFDQSITFNNNTSSLLSTHQQSVKSENQKVPQRILELLTSGNPSKSKKQLVENFTQINSEQLNEVLSTYFKEAMEKGEDPLEVVEKLAEMIPFKKLEQAVFLHP